MAITFCLFCSESELVARVDLKAERKQRKLQVLSALEEPGADRVKVAEALADELLLLARWLGLKRSRWPIAVRWRRR